MYRSLPAFGGDQRAVAEVVRGVMDGKTNNTGSITLAVASAVTTTLTDRRIGVDSLIVFVPFSAAANADTSRIFASAQGQGTATVNHAANVTANKTYRYAVIG